MCVYFAYKMPAVGVQVIPVIYTVLLDILHNLYCMKLINFYQGLNST